MPGPSTLHPLRIRWLSSVRRRDRLSDAALVARVGKDDVAALMELYRRHGRLVYAAARRLGGLETATALTRNAFLTVWRRGGVPEPAGSPSLRSRLLDIVEADVEDRARTGSLGPEARDGSSIELLGALPLAEARVLTLIVVGDCTFRETASLLGSPEANVRRAAVRGLRRLHGVLATPAG